MERIWNTLERLWNVSPLFQNHLNLSQVRTHKVYTLERPLVVTSVVVLPPVPNLFHIRSTNNRELPMTTSLTAYCKSHNLSKSTVHRFLKESELPTDQGITAEVENALKDKFNIADVSTSDTAGELIIAEMVTDDPLAAYSSSALAFSNGRIPETEEIDLQLIQNLQIKADNTRIEQTNFSNLVSEAEIKQAINRGRKRGLILANVERQAQLQAYEDGMLGTVGNDQEVVTSDT